jgi:hypothetical protein
MPYELSAGLILHEKNEYKQMKPDLVNAQLVKQHVCSTRVIIIILLLSSCVKNVQLKCKIKPKIS